MNASEMSNYLNKKCGFFGITGGKSDNRDIEAGVAAGDERCALASNMLGYEIKKQIGAYAAAMGGLDAVVFTAVSVKMQSVSVNSPAPVWNSLELSWMKNAISL